MPESRQKFDQDFRRTQSDWFGTLDDRSRKLRRTWEINAGTLSTGWPSIVGQGRHWAAGCGRAPGAGPAAAGERRAGHGV